MQSAKGRHVMSYQIRLLLGCLIALTSTSAVSAHFRMQRPFAPRQMGPRINPRAMNPTIWNPTILPDRIPATARTPILHDLARQKHLFGPINPYGMTRSNNSYVMSGGNGMNSGASSNMGDTGASSGGSNSNGDYLQQ